MFTNSKHLSTRSTAWFQTSLFEIVRELISYISKCEIKVLPPFLWLIMFELSDLRSEPLNNWRRNINNFEPKKMEKSSCCTMLF